MVSTATDRHFDQLAWILVLFGALLILISVIGTCGLKSDNTTNQACTAIYGVVILLIATSQILFYLIFIYHIQPSRTSYFSELRDDLNLSLQAVFKAAIIPDRNEYTDKIELSPIGNFVTQFQKRFQCCGYYNACDYSWIKTPSSPQGRLSFFDFQIFGGMNPKNSQKPSEFKPESGFRPVPGAPVGG